MRKITMHKKNGKWRSKTNIDYKDHFHQYEIDKMLEVLSNEDAKDGDSFVITDYEGHRFVITGCDEKEQKEDCRIVPEQDQTQESIIDEKNALTKKLDEIKKIVDDSQKYTFSDVTIVASNERQEYSVIYRTPESGEIIYLCGAKKF